MPERLARFVSSEWPGDVRAAIEEWRQERRVWAEMHPGSPIGDAVDQLRAVVRARRALHGWDTP